MSAHPADTGGGDDETRVGTAGGGDDDWLNVDVHLQDDSARLSAAPCGSSGVSAGAASAGGASAAPAASAAAAPAPIPTSPCATSALRRVLEPSRRAAAACASAVSPAAPPADASSSAAAPAPPTPPSPLEPLLLGAAPAAARSNLPSYLGGGGGGGGGASAAATTGKARRDFEAGEARALPLPPPVACAALPVCASAGWPALLAGSGAVIVGTAAAAAGAGAGGMATWRRPLAELLDSSPAAAAAPWTTIPAPSDARAAAALARRWPAAVYVPSARAVLLHGGEAAAAAAAAAPSAAGEELLALDADALPIWYPPAVTGRAPPSAMSGHSLTVIRDYAAGGGGGGGAEYVVLFGGVRARHWLCDTFLLNPRTFRWQQVRTFGKAPTQRAYHAAAAVEGGRRLVVFGGSNGADAFNDVYVLDADSGVSGAAEEERWTWRQPAIRGRGAASVVVGDRYIVYTGGVSPCDPSDGADAPAVRPGRMAAMLAAMAPAAAASGDAAAAATPAAALSGGKRRRSGAAAETAPGDGDDAAAAASAAAAAAAPPPPLDAPPAPAYLCSDVWMLDTRDWEWLQLLPGGEPAGAAAATARVGHAAMLAQRADGGGTALLLVGGLAAGAPPAAASCAALLLPAALGQ